MVFWSIYFATPNKITSFASRKRCYAIRLHKYSCVEFLIFLGLVVPSLRIGGS